MDDNNLNYLVQSQLPTKYEDTYYRGTFTADSIAHAKQLKINLNDRHPYFFSCIVNTLKSNASPYAVGHWVAIIVRYTPTLNQLVLYYFDSFGDSPKKYLPIHKYIDNVRRMCARNYVNFKFDFMTRGLQCFSSKLCGIYSVYCVIKVCHTQRTVRLSLKNIFAKFTGSRRENDKKMITYVKSKWPNDYCHDNSSENGNFKLDLDKLDKKSQFNPPPFCPKKTLDIKGCLKTCLCSSCLHM